MSENAQLLTCPGCGASLNPPAGESTMQCPYCNSTVTIAAAAPSGGTTRANPAQDEQAFPETISWQSSQPSAAPSGQRKGKGFLIVLIQVVLVVGIAAAVFFAVRAGFERQLLAFGAQGIGQGMLNEPNYIGVDRNGNIYAGDLKDGRINIFDPTGKFLRLIALGDKVTIRSFAVAPDGTIYLSYDGKIHRRDAQGNDTTLPYNNTGNSPAFFDAISLGADGSLYAADSEQDEIFRFGPDGTANLAIPKVFGSVTGNADTDISLAVAGTGDIYVLGREENLVLKYSPEGKYINQFGGKAPDSADAITHGRFQTPEAIAVDGYGRIYVCDSQGVQVFDTNGQYLNSFRLDNNPMDMVFDLNNNLYAVGYVVNHTAKIIKLSIKQPALPPP